MSIITYYGLFSYQKARQLPQGPINVFTFFVIFPYPPYVILLCPKVYIKENLYYNEASNQKTLQHLN
ncbi:hypothetical protein HanIR_Chr12g0601771 [Helianthus annuus]|nr:hypothetical protein HanIR_Chr12g0601771 [Helianthus annuus]